MVTLVGAVVDLLLGVAKVVVGLAAGSQALVADGIHSFSDLATDFLVLFAAKHAHREADVEHPYGHGRIETVATVVLGIALVLVAVGISYDAARRLLDPDLLLHPGCAGTGRGSCSRLSQRRSSTNTRHVQHAACVPRCCLPMPGTAAVMPFHRLSWSSVWSAPWQGYPYLDAVAAIAVGADDCKNRLGSAVEESAGVDR